LNTYKVARKAVGLSIEEAAFRLYIAPRTLQNYEDKNTPPADVVLKMAKEYHRPELTNLYCRETCPIGQAYSYEVLENIDTSLPAVMIKLHTELEEAREVFNKALRLVVNKRERADFSDKEWSEFCEVIQDFLDVEHVVEVLKLALGRMIDVTQLVSQHNQKCRERGYTKRKTAMMAAR
jgi:transcriptional regulator with XRE-family HTH domain